MRSLCEYLHIPIEATMALGDGSNDMTMIEASGIGVAMGNAIPELKALADFVTASNDEAGVSVAIGRFL